MIKLPTELINKIMLYNSTPLADMIKQYWIKVNDIHDNLIYDIAGNQFYIEEQVDIISLLYYI